MLGQRAVGVVAAEERRNAAAAGAGEVRAAVGIVPAHDGLAHALIAALIGAAIAVDEAIGPGPTYEVVAIAVLVLRAILVAPAEIDGHAFVAQAALSAAAIAVVAARSVIDAAHREEVAKLTARLAIHVLRAASGLCAHRIQAREQGWTISVDPTLPFELAHAVVAKLAGGARASRTALIHEDAQKLHTGQTRSAVLVNLALAREHALAPYALVAASTRLAAVALDVGYALEIPANEGVGALPIDAALAGEHAPTGSTALPGIAIGVDPALHDGNALAVDAHRTLAALEIVDAAPVRHAHAVAAHLAGPAGPVPTALRRVRAAKIFANKSWQAVASAPTFAHKEARAAAADLTHAAFGVDSTFGRGNALTAIAYLAGTALGVDDAADGHASPVFTQETGPAVAVAATSGGAAGHARPENALLIRPALVVANAFGRRQDDAKAKGAALARPAVIIVDALIAGPASTLDAHERVGATARTVALELGNAPASDARHAGSALGVVAAVHRNTAPELTLLVGTALPILPTPDRHTGTLETAAAAGTLVVASTAGRFEAEMATALAAGGAVDVISTLDRNADVIETGLLPGAVPIANAGGRHAGAANAQCATRAVIVPATPLDHASVLHAASPGRAVAVTDALGDDHAAVGLAPRAKGALVIVSALGSWHAEVPLALLAGTAVPIASTLRSGYAALVVADLQRRAVPIVAALRAGHTQTAGAVEPGRAVGVDLAFHERNAAILLADESVPAISITLALGREPTNACATHEIGRTIHVPAALGRGDAIAIDALAPPLAVRVVAAAHGHAHRVDALLVGRTVVVTPTSRAWHATARLAHQVSGALAAVNALGAALEIGAAPARAVVVGKALHAGAGGTAKKGWLALRMGRTAARAALKCRGIADQVGWAVPVNPTSRLAALLKADQAGTAIRIRRARTGTLAGHADAQTAFADLADAAVWVLETVDPTPILTPIAWQAPGVGHRSALAAHTDLSRLAVVVGVAQPHCELVGHADVGHLVADEAGRAQADHARRAGDTRARHARMPSGAILGGFALQRGAAAAGQEPQQAYPQHNPRGRIHQEGSIHGDLATILNSTRLFRSRPRRVTLGDRGLSGPNPRTPSRLADTPRETR